ncbi:MAG: hypothetical protein Q4G66_05845 [bacterium]|nr:hypothetical protein [bacterium]
MTPPTIPQNKPSRTSRINGQSGLRQAGLVGMPMVLCPIPLLLPYLGTAGVLLSTGLRFALAALATGCCLLCALNIEYRPGLGNIFGITALCAAFAASFAAIAGNPFAALAGSTGLIALGALVLDWTPQPGAREEKNTARRLRRARWAAWTASILVVGIPLLELAAPGPNFLFLLPAP